MTSGSISAPYIIPLRVGQTSKFSIDTNTLIEIGSDTQDVDIYYTLDGSKPDSYVTLGSRRATIQYLKPFYVPRELATSGKVTIKAVAVSLDGIRESSVVTKVFDIKIVPSDHIKSEEYENQLLSELQQQRQGLMRKIQDENEQMQQKLSESMRRSAMESYIQTNQFHQTHSHSPQQTSPLRCAHCFAPKATDSYARYCTECGLPWQKLTSNPVEINHSTKTCENCQSTIAFDSDTCVVCGNSPSTQKQGRSKIQNQTRIICPQCKSANPMHLRTCYVCEGILTPASTPPEKRSVVSVPTPSKPIDKTLLTCSKCLRLNNPDARFCDWCGAFPERSPTSIKCARCQSQNSSLSKFCSTCGCVLEMLTPVVDSRLRNEPNALASSMIAGTLTRNSASPVWLNANHIASTQDVSYSTPKQESATQTYGIYYPSAKDVDLIITQNKRLLAEREVKENRPVLTAVSPGKGYWRQQLDHMFAHIRTYTSNRPDFQSLVGEPRMGKMIHATMHETEYQVTFQAVFSKPEDLSRASSYAKKTSEYYPTDSERSSVFLGTNYSDDEYPITKMHPPKAKHHAKKRPQSAINSTTSPIQNSKGKYRLIELLERKRSDYKKKPLNQINVAEEVKRLLKDEKVKINVPNREDYTVLQLAVRNGHHDCLEALIKYGAVNVNEKGPGGNTAVHESCLLGPQGVDALDTLLKYGGDVRCANRKNETAVDIASKSGCERLMQVILKYREENILKESMKHSHYPVTSSVFHGPRLYGYE